MIFEFKENNGEGCLKLHKDNQLLVKNFYKDKNFIAHTIAWNNGTAQRVVIDEMEYIFDQHTVLPLMLNQSYKFEHPELIVAIQFNREFYCIVDHDAEVGCAGYIFFGPSPVIFIKLSEPEQEKFTQLVKLMEEEMLGFETIKATMLRMMLVQMIILLTRISKKQHLAVEPKEEQFDLLRRYNLLVELNFRKEKQVKFYAAQLNKSPKTISNIFSKYCKKSPQTIIHDRLATEAMRLIYYTDKSVKEIAAELGFEDVSHFSKFIKNHTTRTPTEIKKEKGSNLVLA